MIDSSYAKDQVAVVDRKLYRYFHGAWRNIGTLNKYSTPVVDSLGYVVLTYDSDFDLIAKALTPVISLPSVDSDGNNIVWNPTIISNRGAVSGTIVSLTPTSGSNFYTISPTKNNNTDVQSGQSIVFRSSTLPSFTYDSNDLMSINVLERRINTRALEYTITYGYEAMTIDDATVSKHMYNGVSVGVPAVEFFQEDNITIPSDIEDMYLDSSGTNLYAPRSSAPLRHYKLTTPEDFNTIQSSYVEFNPYSYHATSLRDVSFSPNGKKMFLLNSYSSPDKILQYELDSAYHPTDTTTRLLINKFQDNDIGDQFEISYDGTHMFSKNGSTLSSWELFDGDSSRDLYNIATTKNNGFSRVRSAVLPSYNQSYLVNGYASYSKRQRGAINILRYTGYGYYYQHYYSHNSQPRAYCFNRPGTKYWSATNIAATEGIIYEYSMKNSFDTSFINNTVSRKHAIGWATGLEWTRQSDNSIQKMAWSADGSRFFVLDTYSHSLYQFYAKQAFQIRSIGSSTSATLKPLSSAIYSSGGYEQVKQLSEIPTTSPTNAPWNGGYGNYQTSNMKNFFFNDDGTKLRVSNDDDIFEYTLATPFDLANITYDGANTDFSYRTGSKYKDYLTPSGSMWMADSDKKFYITQTDIVYQFELDSGLSSARNPYTQREIYLSDIITGQSNFTGMQFNDSGHTLYLTCRNNNNVYKLYLDSAYDLRDVSYVSMYDTPSLITDLQGIVTTRDETRMHLINGNTRTIYEIDINSNFESSQYNGINYLTVNPGNTKLTGMYWNDDGDEFTVIGNSKIDTYLTDNNFRVIPL